MARQRKSQIALMLLVMAQFAACAPPGKSQSTPKEQPFRAQIAAVRAGQLDQIQIEQSPLVDDDLPELAGLANLRVLLLDHPGSRFSAAGLKHLAPLTNLQHLRLRGPGIDDKSLTQLATIESLRILNIPQAEFTDAALANLARLTHLEQLRFGSPHVTDAGLKMLAQFPALKRLHLIDVPMTDAGLRELARLAQLESLYIDGGHITDRALDELFRQRPDLHVHVNQQHHDRDPHRHPHP